MAPPPREPEAAVAALEQRAQQLRADADEISEVALSVNEDHLANGLQLAAENIRLSAKYLEIVIRSMKWRIRFERGQKNSAGQS